MAIPSTSHAEPAEGSARTDGGRDHRNEIAIVGFAIEFPQCNSEDEFWEILMSGECVASKFPHGRISRAKLSTKATYEKGTISTERASFLSRDIGAFDAKFFGMTPEEASGTDPQQRIILETTYRALENAGITMRDINGSNASVHVGSFTYDYLLATAKGPEAGPKYGAAGMAGSMLSNKISTFFNLTGPSITIDTACSSSLVALDMACQSIQHGHSSLGIVVGSSILLSKDFFIGLSNLGFLSPDGVCHAFDQRANGYGRGEGIGVLVLQSVGAAIQQGRLIRSIIRARGTNQNGRTSLAVPSKEMQRQLINDTYSKANLDKSQTRFFEAHGTGTPVGDPAEAMAIGSSLGLSRSSFNPLVIGAVKANIGHLEGAAGVAGVIKTILVLERGIIPPIAGLEELNSEIDAEFLKLKFPRRPIAWPCEGLRRASVNSFGFGGTNAHIVLDDAFHYPLQRGLVGNHKTSVPCQGNLLPDLDGGDSLTAIPRLFLWSAADEGAIDRLTKLYQVYCERLSSESLGSSESLSYLAYVLATKRSSHLWRRFEVADSFSQLSEQLSKPTRPRSSLPDPRLGLVFTGQGAHWVGMGRELVAFPIFRKSIIKAENFLANLGSPWKVNDMLFGARDLIVSKIDEPRYAQPLCTILQIALVELLSSIGVKASVVVGHSSGEIAAAYAAGGICRESAWKLAYFRGLLASNLAKASRPEDKCSMMAVAASPAVVQPLMDEIMTQQDRGRLSVACLNSPQNTTIAGTQILLQALKTTLDAKDIFCRILKVPVAYHSPQMQDIISSYKELVGSLDVGDSSDQCPAMVSSVTGQHISRNDLACIHYWVANLVSPVNFSAAMEVICRNSESEATHKLDLSHRNRVAISGLLEIGPHSALQGPVREVLNATEPATKDITYLSVLVRGNEATTTFLQAVGRLWCLGLDLDLKLLQQFYGHTDRWPISLPSLPEYPFDHSKTYWDEPQISKNMRIPPKQSTQLLGSPVADWNPLEPRWRNTLTITSIPWLEDHKINGEILFPAAGMIALALEAITQVNSEKDITAYEVKDLNVLTGLPIPPDDIGVDIQFRLKPLQKSSDQTDSRCTFSLYSCQGSEFVEVARGTVKAVLRVTEVSGLDEKAVDLFLHTHEESYAISDSKIEPVSLYRDLASIGYEYGPLFQGIRGGSHTHQGQAVAEVLVRSPAPATREGQQGILHTSTIDSMLQVSLPAVAQRDLGRRHMWLPTSFAKIWISRNTSLHHRTSSEVLVRSLTEVKSRKLCSSKIDSVNKSDGDCFFRVEGLQFTALLDQAMAADARPSSTDARRLCYEMVYKPDFTLLSQEQLNQYLCGFLSKETVPRDLFRKIKLYNLVSFSRAISAVPVDRIPKDLPHLGKQYAWAKRKVESAKRSPPSGVPVDWETYTDDPLYESLCEDVKSAGQLGEIHVHFGRNITEFFLGSADPLEILATDNILEEFHDTMQGRWGHLPVLEEYVDMLAHKNPGMNILEIGAGTGATTKRIISKLARKTSNKPVSRFSRYDFTDISASFLSRASEHFSHLPKVLYGLFDVERDPASQNYEEHTYDLVIAVNVLHATRSLQNTLANVRKLLQDDGKLILIEITATNSMMAHSIFGFLPGWWLSTEPWRQDDGPCATVPLWDKELREGGFTGVDAAFNDFEDESHCTSLMLSTRESRPEKPPIPERVVRILNGFKQVSLSTTAQLVAAQMSRVGYDGLCVSNFYEAAQADNLQFELVLVVQEAGWPGLGSLSEAEYHAFHGTVSKARNVLWLVAVPTAAGQAPPMAIIRGLARSLRNEYHDLIFSCVAVDPLMPDTLPGVIEKAIQNWLRGVDTGTYERELVQYGEALQAPRIYEADPFNRMVHEYKVQITERQQPFGAQNVKLDVRRPGLLDTLYFREAPGLDPLAAGQIRVEVKAIGVNFKDCLVMFGSLDETTIGTECAGVVVGVGPDCRLRPGDRVAVCTLDTYQHLIQCLEEQAVEIPDGMSFTDAASIPVNFITAYHSLITQGGLSAGEAVLIHSGSGGTGQAAIQVAKCCGAELFTTVGSSEKRDFLATTYGIPHDHIFSSRDTSFADRIKSCTGNRGVDVVLNSLTGEALVASWECVAPYGRFIEIGKRDIIANSGLPMSSFLRNVSFSAVDIASMAVERPAIIHSAFVDIMDLFRRGILRPSSPINIFPISQVGAAFRHIQKGSHIGKVVIEADPGDVVTAVVNARQDWSFGAGDTFLIAGGLGGQGRSIASWMASKGARNLVLLSRSGASSEKSKSFVNKLQDDEGVNVFCPKCDIGDVESLRVALEQCRARMLPIKGSIQATMDIKDSIFQDMDYDSWHGSLRPKVAGSWNLHRQLPIDLDFFILFSSVAGVIGTEGQSNYAAGNVFEDEVAASRRALGGNAVSLNLGVLVDEGWASERQDMIKQYLGMRQLLTMDQTEIFALLDHYCRRENYTSLTEPCQQCRRSQPDPQSQLVTGLDLPADVTARGLDQASWMSEPLFLNLHQAVSSADGGGQEKKKADTVDLGTKLAAAKTLPEAGDIVTEALAAKVTSVLALTPDEFSRAQPLYAYGVDSLIAIEIRNWLRKSLKVEVAAFEILGGSTADALGRVVAGKVWTPPQS
ncbi:putative polyketide synthase [Hypoxylon sp. FL1284]|nr:putative polyketide synthase [Hypoxylon sp. FL1284]